MLLPRPAHPNRCLALLVACLATRILAADNDNPVLIDWRPYDQLPASESANIAPYCPGGFVDPMQFDPRVDPSVPDSEVPLTFNFNYSPDLSLDNAELIGDVSARQNTLQVFADYIRYQTNTNQGELEGSVRLRTLGYLVTGEQSQLNFDAREFNVDQANFVLHQEDLHGSADALQRHGADLIDSQGVTFTRCMPQDPAWAISAASLQVDRETGIAKAWHARFKIQSVPVLYLPYVSFPIDERRRTGFVTATYGANELLVPYYLNLAPNYDDTLTLGYFADLGLLARNEFRFLTRNHNGISDLDWLITQNTDPLETASLEEDTEETPRRWAIRHRQSGRLGQATSYQVDTRWVSDAQFDQNFNNGDLVENQRASLGLKQRIPTGLLRLDAKATTPVQDGDSNFETASVKSSTRIGNLQPSVLGEWQFPIDSTVTAGQHGLRRLPEISVNYRPANLPGSFALNNASTYTRFTRQIDNDRLASLESDNFSLATETHRLYSSTGFSYPFNVAWGYLRPELEAIYLGYDLDNQLDPEFDFRDEDFVQNPDVGNWRFTVDSKVIVEKPYATRTGLVVHSIEPRLYYTYTPYQDQDDLPNLNTSPTGDFKTFTNSRFRGLDRIGDMNRFSFGFDNRLREKSSGREILQVGFSKMLKLEQERVTRGDADPVKEDFAPTYSPTFFNLRWTPDPKIQFNASAQWANRTMELERFSGDMTFLPEGNSFIRLGATGNAKTQSAAFSGYWPVRENIALIGYANWERPVTEGRGQGDFLYTDLVYGIDYDNCCWNIRLVSYNTPEEDEEEDAEETTLFPARSEQGIKFEFTLKGLGGSTGNVETLLDTKVPGYRGPLYNSR